MKQAVKTHPASKPDSWIPEPTLVSIIAQLHRNPGLSRLGGGWSEKLLN